MPGDPLEFDFGTFCRRKFTLHTALGGTTPSIIYKIMRINAVAILAQACNRIHGDEFLRRETTRPPYSYKTRILVRKSWEDSDWGGSRWPRCYLAHLAYPPAADDGIHMIKEKEKMTHILYANINVMVGREGLAQAAATNGLSPLPPDLPLLFDSPLLRP